LEFNILFSIGEMAKLCNVTPKTLRFYNQIGLLEPAKINPENGYRFYTEQSITRVLSIKQLQDMQHPYIDIHAGATETNWMLLDYPEVVDEKLARQMKPTSLMLPQLKEWLRGGETAKKYTPLGYFGAPGDIDFEKSKFAQSETVKAYVQTIYTAL